jgi:cytochrome P450
MSLGTLSGGGLRPPAPTPRDRPLGPLGLLNVLRNNPLEAWSREHFERPVVSLNLLLGHVVLASEPSAIRRVLVDNAENYHKDSLQQRVLSAGLGDGLLAVEGPQWRAQRRTLAPMFSRRTVIGFAPAMARSADALVARWRAQDGNTVDVAAEMTRVTIDVLEQTIFSDGLGREPEQVRKAMAIYFDTIGRIDPFDVIGLPSFVPRLSRIGVGPVLRFFDSAVDDIVATRRRNLATNPAAVPRDILTLLLEAQDPETGRGMTETEVRANILTFIAAGQETTANALTWALFLLSQSPEWNERVAAEADREIGGPVESLAERLPVTRAVIDEAMRLYPPIVAISRVALAADQLAGEPVKQGSLVVIAPYVLHRHRQLWSQPDLFAPERFLGAARETIDRFAYLPFGIGPRTCIGGAFALQEATLVLAMIAKSFTLELAAGHRVWPVQKVTLRPDNGLPMIPRLRSKPAPATEDAPAGRRELLTDAMHIR